MCTVSVVPTSDGFRLTCNRDERRARARALPPGAQRTGGLSAIWPTDSQGGGTWIGANEGGLAMALLNRTSGRERPAIDRPISRGTIIPVLLGDHTLRRALQTALALPVQRYEPFTLLLVQRDVAAVVANDGRRLTIAMSALHRPVVLASSSLGDDRVWPRLSLFARLVRRNPAPLGGQARFHRHRWRRRPEISVCMSRVDACTVSRTVLDVGRASIVMRYEPLSSL